MCAPSPPPAPDYTGAALQQGQQNVDAAKVQGKINNPNVITPYGTQTVTYGSGTVNQAAYDKAQQDYQRSLSQWQAAGGVPRVQIGMSKNQPVYRDTPRPTAPDIADYSSGDPNQATLRQTLSPEQQALYNQRTATQMQLGQVAGQGAEALKGVVGTPVDFTGAPTTGSYEDTRKRVIEASMGRANEDYLKRLDAERSNLIAAGIRPGSKAFGDVRQMTERGLNDARTQAEIAGGNAASQAYGMDADRRRQYMSELLAQRQTPLNEISALLSGSQVSNPFAAPGYAQNAQVAPAPLFGATQLAGDYQTDLYNQQAAQQGRLVSGLFGLGGSALMGAGAAKGSDRRIKRQATRIGTHPLGIGLYRFRYKPHYVKQWGHGWQIGFMADEVLRVKPDAVSRHVDGYLLVNYGVL